MIFVKKILKKISKDNNKVIISNGSKHSVENIELVDVGIVGIKTICTGCVFNTERFTCMYEERQKMTIDCFDVNNSHYELKK